MQSLIVWAALRWMTRPDHPLTWYLIVNRVWQYHFGRGIVDSPNDFGRMGQLPTHAALLDWLAVQFRDNGQSFRKLHRLIVTITAAYCQVLRWVIRSRADRCRKQISVAHESPPVEAEEIRDAVLAVSGKLNPESGGPGFYLFELGKA